MGRSHRVKPAYLAKKLKQIRVSLGLSQSQLITQLKYTASPLTVSNISEFEYGKREPTLQLILQYARLAGVSVESIIDDEMELDL